MIQNKSSQREGSSFKTTLEPKTHVAIMDISYKKRDNSIKDYCYYGILPLSRSILVPNMDIGNYSSMIILQEKSTCLPVIPH